MLRSDIKPNVRTYTALIAALGNAGQWERALEVVQRMRRHAYGSGIEPNAYTYSGESLGLGWLPLGGWLGLERGCAVPQCAA